MNSILRRTILLVILLISVSSFTKDRGVDVSSTPLSLVKQDSLFYYDLLRKSDSLFKLNKNAESLKQALELIRKIKSTKDVNLFIKVNELVGDIWYNNKSYLRAISYYKHALLKYNIKENEENFISDDIGKSLLKRIFEIGKSYHRLLENNEDIEKYKDSAIFYYEKVLNSGSFNQNILELE